MWFGDGDVPVFLRDKVGNVSIYAIFSELIHFHSDRRGARGKRKRLTH